MRTPQRTQLMIRYFNLYGVQRPSYTRLFIVALSTFLFGLFIIYAFNNTLLAGILAMIFGASLFIVWIRPFFKDKSIFQTRPSIAQMHNWLIADLNDKIKERSKDILRLNMSELRSENFLILTTPIYWEEGGVNRKFIKRREAEKYKFIYSVWKVQVVALSKNYISFFDCIYDWLNDKVIDVKTDEYFYDDIVSVKSDVRRVEKKFIDQAEDDKSTRTISEHILKITNMASESHYVVIKIPEMRYSPELEVNVEKAVQALRVTLRKRRYLEEQDPIIVEVERPEEAEEHEAENKEESKEEDKKL